MKNAVIVMARCQKNRKLFGMRFEQVTDQEWYANWAFKISEEASKREGYDKTTIRGRIGFSGEYPGCPYCEQRGGVVCSCGKQNCHGQSQTMKCAWCGIEGTVGGDATSLDSTSGM